MIRKWVPSGRLDGNSMKHVPFNLKDAERGALLDILGRNREGATEFVNGMDYIVGQALAFKDHAENCSVKNVRKRLRKVRAAADKLEQALAGLDDLSQDLWDEASTMCAREAGKLSSGISAVANEALSFALQFPDSKKEDLSKQNLAFQVAGALDFHLGVKLTKSHTFDAYDNYCEGLFSQCLRVIFSAAEMTVPRDLFRLSVHSIKSLEFRKSFPVDNSEFEVDGYD